MSNPGSNLGLISCIIPVYNRADLIIECVESVLGQTYRNYEIIIVDDGSTDDTAKVLHTLSDQHPKLIKVISQNNNGPGAARQTGLNHSSGEFVQFLDSDDLIKPSKFQRFIHEFNAPESPDIVFCITHYYPIAEPENYIVWKQPQHQTSSILPDFLVSRAWSTSTPIYKKMLLDKAGEILALSCEEDLEYDCRIGLQAPKLKFVNEYLTDFRDHQGQRFSVNHPNRANQIGDQIKARQHIYQTIVRFNLCRKSREMAFFSKSMFLLARQAGQMGLHDQARSALEVTRQCCQGQSLGIRFPVTVFQTLCSVIGISRGAQLFSTVYDRLHRLKNNISGKPDPALAALDQS